MAQQRWSLEIKVGAFVVLGFALLVFFVFAIGDLNTLFEPGHKLHVYFDSANGITDGSPVQYAGVEVGKVQGIKIVYPEPNQPQVQLTVQLPDRVQVRADDEAAISTFGLLGEKYLEITPGPGAGAILEPGGLLVGRPPVSTDQIIERSDKVLSELHQALQGLNSFVGNEEARTYFVEAMKEARDATRQWKFVGERLNLALLHAESGQGTLGHFLYDEELYNRSVAFIDDLRANPWKLLIRPKKKDQQKQS